MNYYTNAELSQVSRHLCCHITVASFLAVSLLRHCWFLRHCWRSCRCTHLRHCRVLRHRHRVHHYRHLRQCRFLRLHYYRHLRRCRFFRYHHHLHHCRHSRHRRFFCRCTVLHHRRQFLLSSPSMSSSPLTPLSFLTPQSLLPQCRFLRHPGHLITLTSVDCFIKALKKKKMCDCQVTKIKSEIIGGRTISNLHTLCW